MDRIGIPNDQLYYIQDHEIQEGIYAEHYEGNWPLEEGHIILRVDEGLPGAYADEVIIDNEIPHKKQRLFLEPLNYPDYIVHVEYGDELEDVEVTDSGDDALKYHPDTDDPPPHLEPYSPLPPELEPISPREENFPGEPLEQERLYLQSTPTSPPPLELQEDVRELPEFPPELEIEIHQKTKKQWMNSFFREQNKGEKNSSEVYTTMVDSINTNEVFVIGELLEEEETEPLLIEAICLQDRRCGCNECLDILFKSEQYMKLAFPVLQILLMKIRSFIDEQKLLYGETKDLAAHPLIKTINNHGTALLNDILNYAFSVLVKNVSYADLEPEDRSRVIRMSINHTFGLVLKELIDLQHLSKSLIFFHEVMSALAHQMNLALQFTHDSINFLRKLEKLPLLPVKQITFSQDEFNVNSIPGDKEKIAICNNETLATLRTVLLNERENQKKYLQAKLTREERMLKRQRDARVAREERDKQPRAGYEWFHALKRVMGATTPRLASFEPPANAGGRHIKRARGKGAAANNAKREEANRLRKEKENIRKRRLPTLTQYLQAAQKLDEEKVVLDKVVFELEELCDISELIADIICTKIE